MSRLPRRRVLLFWLAAPVVLPVVVSACAAGAVASDPSVALQQVPGGDPERGQQAIVAYGCGACHTIPGVPGAIGRVAPSLDGWGTRTSILGLAPNTPQELIRWIRDPEAFRPGTTMPQIGVSEEDARQIAAYLLTLK